MVLSRKKVGDSQERYIGRRVKIFWQVEKEWFTGIVKEINSKRKRYTVRIEYDDGDEEWGLFVESGTAFSVRGAERLVEWPAAEGHTANVTVQSPQETRSSSQESDDVRKKPPGDRRPQKRPARGDEPSQRGGKRAKTSKHQNSTSRGRGRPRKKNVVTGIVNDPGPTLHEDQPAAALQQHTQVLSSPAEGAMVKAGSEPHTEDAEENLHLHQPADTSDPPVLAAADLGEPSGACNGNFKTEGANAGAEQEAVASTSQPLINNEVVPGLGLLDQLSHISATTTGQTEDPSLQSANNSLSRSVSDIGPAVTKITRIGSSRSASAVVGNEAVVEDPGEVQERCVHLGSMLEVLTRTRDSIGEATTFILSGARCGGAKALIKTVVRRLEGEPQPDRRVDFFYLIDSTVQRSVRPGKADFELDPGQPLTGPLSAAGQHFPEAVGSMLPRIVAATGGVSEDGAKKVEKVLSLWKSRAVMEARHVDAALQKLRAVKSEPKAPAKTAGKDGAHTSHGTERQPRRRNQSTAVTQANSIGVSEYGSTATLLMLLGCTEGVSPCPGISPTPAAISKALADKAPTSQPFRVPPWVLGTATEAEYQPCQAAELQLQLCQAKEMATATNSPDSPRLETATHDTVRGHSGHDREAGEPIDHRPAAVSDAHETERAQYQQDCQRPNMRSSPWRQQQPPLAAVLPPPLPSDTVPPTLARAAQEAAPVPPLPQEAGGTAPPPPLPDTAPPPLPDGSPPPLPAYSPPPLPAGSPPGEEPGYSPPPVPSPPRHRIVGLEPRAMAPAPSKPGPPKPFATHFSPRQHSPSMDKPMPMPQGYSPVPIRSQGMSPPSSYQALQPQEPNEPMWARGQLSTTAEREPNSMGYGSIHGQTSNAGIVGMAGPPEAGQTPGWGVLSTPVDAPRPMGQWPGQQYTPSMLPAWTPYPPAPMPTPESAVRTPADAASSLYPRPHPPPCYGYQHQNIPPPLMRPFGP